MIETETATQQQAEPVNGIQRETFCGLCGAPVTSTGRGRPRSYCSTGCGRAWNAWETYKAKLDQLLPGMSLDARQALRLQMLRDLQETIRPDHRRRHGPNGKFISANGNGEPKRFVSAGEEKR